MCAPRKHCRVTEINFNGRNDLHGFLDEKFLELTHLQSLSLAGTRVAGDVQVLRNAHELVWLQVSNTRISGDLKSLSNAIDLRTLILKSTQISGDLAALGNSTSLHEVLLGDTDIRGDLSALARATKLSNLYLANTKISGDLRNLPSFLFNLDLSNTDIQGDLSMLSSYLYSLRLSNTRVTGDVGALTNFGSLAILALDNTQVSGDIAQIGKSQMEHLDLSSTQVFGHPKDWQRNRLETLNLARTKVRFLEDFLESWLSYRWTDTTNIYCPFPGLRFLDVSGTMLNCSVSQLLEPFLGCSLLRTIKAANGQLTGTIPKGIVPKGIHIFMPTEAWPLSTVLATLDLAFNFVMEVQAIPPSCRTLILNGNALPMTFALEAFRRAVADLVFIDLRNVTFANQTDACLASLA